MDQWLVNYEERPSASILLYCLPYAGGSAAIYRDWKELVHPSIDLWAIELPGRGLRWAEPAVPDIAQLSSVLAEILIKAIDRPFSIFGHSMGGLIGFDITRKIKEKSNKIPKRLFISGCLSPECRGDAKFVHNLLDKDFISHLHTLNGTPPEVLENQELMQIILPVLRTDFRACSEHRFPDDAIVECPISAYGGLSDPEVTRKGLVGWRRRTLDKFTVKMFEGDHFFLRKSKDRLVHSINSELISG